MENQAQVASRVSGVSIVGNTALSAAKLVMASASRTVSASLRTRSAT